MDMRVNIGCGDCYAPGWLNVDATNHRRIRKDMLGDVVAGLDLPDGCAEAVYLGHVLEHISLDDVDTAMREVVRLLAPGGEVMAVGPDCDRARASGDRNLVAACVNGGGRWAHDVHLWESTEGALVKILTDAGLTDVEAVPIRDVRGRGDWPLVDDVWWQAAAYGRKPE